MALRIYVGNLPYQATEDAVRELFADFGPVLSVRLITDRETGRPRGFAFVEMSEGGENAIGALDGKDFGGRRLYVNEARPREAGGARDGGGSGHRDSAPRPSGPSGGGDGREAAGPPRDSVGGAGRDGGGRDFRETPRGGGHRDQGGFRDGGYRDSAGRGGGGRRSRRDDDY